LENGENYVVGDYGDGDNVRLDDYRCLSPIESAYSSSTSTLFTVDSRYSIIMFYN